MMRRLTGGCLVLLVPLLVGACGCARPGPSREQMAAQLDAYQRALVDRDQRLATLGYQVQALARDHAALAAHLEQARRAERLVTQRLEALIALDDRIAEQLQQTQKRLAPPDAEDPEAAKSKPQKPEKMLAELEAAQAELLQQLREGQALRTEAVQELVRTIQYLVDTGQLHVTRGEGRPTISVPRSLDIEDPWRYR